MHDPCHSAAHPGRANLNSTTLSLISFLLLEELFTRVRVLLRDCIDQLSAPTVEAGKRWRYPMRCITVKPHCRLSL